MEQAEEEKACDTKKNESMGKEEDPVLTLKEPENTEVEARNPHNQAESMDKTEVKVEAKAKDNVNTEGLLTMNWSGENAAEHNDSSVGNGKKIDPGNVSRHSVKTESQEAVANVDSITESIASLQAETANDSAKTPGQDFEVVGASPSTVIPCKINPKKPSRGRPPLKSKGGTPKYLIMNRKSDYVYDMNELADHKYTPRGSYRSRSAITVEEDPKLKLPFDHGWRRELVWRKPADGVHKMCDVYYFPPGKSPKLRSMVQVEQYLNRDPELSVRNFTFSRSPIYKPPHETVRFAGDSGSRVGRPKKSNTKGTDPKGASPKKLANSVSSSMPTFSHSSHNSQSSTPIIKEDETSIVIKLNTSGAAKSNPAAVQKPPGPVNPGPKPPAPSVPRPAVAKKRTGSHSSIKRSYEVAGKAAPLPSEKRMRLEEASLPPQLCGMECPGREGIPPTMHCSVCMCLFHPQCVKVPVSARLDSYLCQTCQVVTGGKVPSTSAPTSSGLANGGVSMTTKAPAAKTFASTAYMPLGGISISSPVTVMGTSLLNNNPIMSTLNNPVMSTVNQGVPGMMTDIAQSATAHSINVSHLANQQQVSAHLLTLPPSLHNKLDIEKPLTIRVNNQNITVPPSCLIADPMGIKVFLPPGIVNNAMDTSSHSTSLRAANIKTNSSDPQSYTVLQPGQALTTENCRSDPSIVVPDVASYPVNSSKVKIRKSNRLAHHYCHIYKLHGGFDCMLKIFDYLGVSDLLVASQVCHIWKNVVSQSSLWSELKLRGCCVTDWEAAAQRMQQCHTHTLDLRGMEHCEGDQNRTWHQLTSVLCKFHSLCHLHFGPCPALILHSVAEKLTELHTLTAESISDNTDEQMWSCSAKLDIGKLKNMKQLQELRLRAVCGLIFPGFSLSGGLVELANLQQLKKLSLTTMKQIPDSECAFIGNLENLEVLELGDCTKCGPKTFQQLGKLVRLRRLRLECSGCEVDEKLAVSLALLSRLKCLELIKFVISKTLSKAVQNLAQLQTLKVWPDGGSQVAMSNTETLAAVSTMRFLQTLEWGIMMDKNQDKDTAENGGSKMETNPAMECLAFLTTLSQGKENKILDASSDTGREGVTFINPGQLMDKLCSFMPDTKIRVFKVPMLNTWKRS